MFLGQMDANTGLNILRSSGSCALQLFFFLFLFLKQNFTGFKEHKFCHGRLFYFNGLDLKKQTVDIQEMWTWRKYRTNGP